MAKSNRFAGPLGHRHTTSPTPAGFRKGAVTAGLFLEKKTYKPFPPREARAMKAKHGKTRNFQECSVGARPARCKKKKVLGRNKRAPNFARGRKPHGSFFGPPKKNRFCAVSVLTPWRTHRKAGSGRAMPPKKTTGDKKHRCRNIR